MPVVFVHGVTVRQVTFAQGSTQVLTGLRHRKSEAEMPYAAYFWGGAAAALRWGGASIPGFTRESQLQQKIIFEDQVPLPDLRMLLSIDPFAELRVLQTGETS